MFRLLPLLFAALLAGMEVGPDSTAVVINGDSPAAETVAREWMRLRGVADDHAIVLHGLPAGHFMPLADFRSRILDAVEAELVRRGLAERVGLIAYSPDLPTAIAFDTPPGTSQGQQGPGSITGLTLLAPLLGGPATGFTALRANPYAERVGRVGGELDQVAEADPRCAKAVEAMVAKDLAGAAALFTALAADHPSPVVCYNRACMLALTGALDDAEAALSRAVEVGWMDARHTAADPDLTALRSRPAWAGLLKRIDANLVLVQPPASVRFMPLRGAPGTLPGRLAMVLGNLGPRGLTLAETQAQLAASVAADGSAPRGTVWFMASGDSARTGPRRWAFPAAARALQELGIAAEIREGVLPPRDAAVIGATIGIADFSWDGSGARMLPGAWSDHLTSFGGALQAGAGQTSLSAFLRAGAAGSGGAVHEPLNHPEKFPSAFVHLHRARGLTLVEAVHFSLPCPYQYLAVGDPLSRPWPATRP